MARPSVFAASALVLIAGAFASATGCHLVAGIEEKTPVVGGGGMGGDGSVNGASVSSSSTGSSSTGGGAGAGGGGGGGGSGGGGGQQLPVGEPAVCDPGGAAVFTGCEMDMCMPPGTPFETSKCHCGECDHHCGGLMCSNYLCNTMIMTGAPGYAYGLTSNGKDIFFASFVEPSGELPVSSIWKVSLNAQNLQSATLLGVTTGRVKVLTADCDDVYFASLRATDANMNVSVPKIQHYRVDSDGNKPDPIYDVPTGLPPESVDYMVVDGDYLYWVDNQAPASMHQVKAWRKGQGVELVFSSAAEIRGLALKGGYLYWTESGTISVKQNIYRAATPPLPALGWNPTVVATNTGRAVAFAVDESFTYWIEDNGGAGVLKRGPNQFVQNATYISLATMTDPGGSLVVDANYVYFMQNASIPAEIWRVSKNVNEPTSASPVLTNLNSAYLATQVIADPGRLYWTSVAAESHVSWVAK